LDVRNAFPIPYSEG
jgi:hypothetical protein